MSGTRIVLGIASALLVTHAAHATVLISEDFENLSSGTVLRTVPGWFGTTNAFQVNNLAGLAASGQNYLVAPSLTGAGDRQRFVWFDASSGFNSRPLGEDTVIASVNMFVPDVTESTYGGMFMFDQFGDSIGVIGLEMLTHRTLTSANSGVNDIDINIGQYNNFEMSANFASGAVIYKVNGVSVGTSQMSAANMTAGFGDFDFYNNGFNANSSVNFRYDDYRVGVAAVPEPETYALMSLGFGLLGFAARRRRGRAAVLGSRMVSAQFR